MNTPTNIRATRKKKHELAIRTTITLPPLLWDKGQDLVRQGGYGGLSDWVQARIRRDAGIGDCLAA